MGAPIVRAPGLSFLENENPIGNLSHDSDFSFHFVPLHYTTFHEKPKSIITKMLYFLSDCTKLSPCCRHNFGCLLKTHNHYGKHYLYRESR